MPIASTDLILYASANMPTADTGTSGGAKDGLRRPVFTQLAANDTIEALSDNAGDTMNITVTGRDPDGTIKSETKALTGTTFISLSTLGTVERILKAELASAPTGTITVRRTTGSVLIADIPPSERGFMIVFYDSFSDPVSAKTRYEKLFWENNHGSLALTQAKVTLTADPSSKLTFDLEDAKDDTNSSTNRETAPTGNLGVWTGVGSALNVPTTSLGSGEAIGTWIRQSLGAGDAPIKNTFDLKLEGQSV